MTRTIARLVLSMLLLPVSMALFILLMLVQIGRGPPSIAALLATWGVLYLFIAAYWLLLWGPAVRWTRGRVFATAAGTGLSLLGGVVVGALCLSLNRILPPQFCVLAGGAVVPMAWVLATVVIWTETPAERRARLAATGAPSLACPVCGYDMTGLTEARCPECGTRFTLEQFLAVQGERDVPDTSAHLHPEGDRVANR